MAERVGVIRGKTDLPVGVGFGIKDGESAARVARIADAVVVGSALVSRMEALQEQSDKIPQQAGAFIAELRAALDNV